MKSLAKKRTELILFSILIFLLTSILVLSGIGIYFKLTLKENPELEVNPLDFSIDTWDGTVSAVDFNESYAGRGTQTKTINSAASFVHFVNEVNNGNTFENYTIYLNSNIDLNGKTINSIGNSENPFKGNFDGGNYTILNAKINGNGLFGQTENATIKNVGLYNASVTQGDSSTNAQNDRKANLIDKAINTNIENCFVRLGNGKLINEFISNNGTHYIKNSFVDSDANGLIGKINTNNSSENAVTISNSYFTQGENATTETDEFVTLENVIKATNISDFSTFNYSKKYNTTNEWCDYAYLEGSNKLDFTYPVQSGFVKVYLTGSYYESVVVTGNTTVDAENLAVAFTEADKEAEATINLLVEKIFMEARAEVTNASVTINAVKDTTIIRGENNLDSMFVGTGSSKIVIGSDTTTVTPAGGFFDYAQNDNCHTDQASGASAWSVSPNQNTTLCSGDSSTALRMTDLPTITLDGNREYIEENNLSSGALVVAYGSEVEIHENVTIKNNINNNDVGYGGAVLLYNTSEKAEINANIYNCYAEIGGGAIASIGVAPQKVGSIKYCSTSGNGGAIYLASEIEESVSLSAMSKLYGTLNIQQINTTTTNETINIAGQTFENNMGELGSAIYVSGDGRIDFGSTESERTYFINNHGTGGAICYQDVSAINTIQFVTFEGNRQYTDAGIAGGAIYINGAAGEGEHEATFGEGCVFTNNYAYYNGGAIYTDSYDLNFSSGATFTSNRATDGAVIYADSNVTINETSIFTSNKANKNIIYVSGSINLSGDVQFNQNESGNALILANLSDGSKVQLNGGSVNENETTSQICVVNEDGTGSIEIGQDCKINEISIENGENSALSLKVIENLTEEQNFEISVDNANLYANTGKTNPILIFASDVNSDLTKFTLGDYSFVQGGVVNNETYAYLNMYEVEYVITEDSSITQTYKAGDEIVKIEDPTREGYTFEGWLTEDGSEIPTTMPEENIKVYAKWEIITYYITFVVADDSLGYGTIDTENITALYGDEISFKQNVLTISNADYSHTITANPAVDPTGQYAYKFVSWEGTIETIDQNVVIKVHFAREINKHKVTIVATPEGYGTVSAQSVTVEYGKSISAEGNILKIEGIDDISATATTNNEQYTYAFENWSGIPENNLIVEPITIYANFLRTVNSYKVNFDANGGEVSETEKNVNYGEPYGTLPIPTREGYEFVGWFTEAIDGTKITETTILSTAEEHTLFAHWAEEVYSITFYYDENEIYHLENIEYLKPISLPQDPEREGYLFDGWYYEKEWVNKFNLTETPTMPANSFKLYAKWTIKTFIITATSEGNGTITPSGDTETEYSSNLKFEFAADEGYQISSIKIDNVELLGEELTNAIANKSYTFKNITTSHTIEVKFTICSYNLTYDLMYDDQKEVKVYEYNQTITHLTDLIREGYTFKGWSTDDGSEVPATMPAKDITLYAEWEKNSYTITYYLDADKQTKYAEYEILFLDPIQKPEDPTMQGFKFGRWINFDDDSEFTLTEMPAKNLEVYAKWLVNAYTITFNLNYETTEKNIEKVFDAGETVEFSNPPTRTGYKLIDWYLETSFETVFDFIMPANNITVYAKWKKETYTINSTSGENGTISPLGATNVEYNANLTYTFTANDGYYISEIKIDNVALNETELADAISKGYTFENISSNHTIHVEFTIKTYTITATSEGNGTISNIGETIVEHNSNLTYTFTVEEGYYVGDIKVDNVSLVGEEFENAVNNGYTFANVTTDHTIHVEFAIYTFKITSTSGTNGTISPLGELPKEYNSQQTYTFTAYSGYYISQIKVDDVELNETELLDAILNGYTFTNIKKDHTIHVEFAIYTYNITSTSGENGTISPIGVTTKEHNSSQTYTFTPNTGYHVSEIKVNKVSLIGQEFENAINNGYTFANIQKDHTIHVEFAIDVYTITATSGANGSIIPQGETEKEYLTSQLYIFTANEGYHVSDVKVDDVSLSGEELENAIESGYTFENISSNHTIHVEFEINTYTIVASCTGYGVLTPVGNNTYSHGEDAVFSISPNIGYSIKNIKIDNQLLNEDFSSVLQYTYTFFNVTSDHTIYVEFSSSAYTITATSEGNGTISPSGVISVAFGENKLFTFEPNEGNYIASIFVNGNNLTGEPLSNAIENGLLFESIDSNHTIHVVFESFKLKIEVSVQGDGKFYCEEDITSIKYGEDRVFKIEADLDKYSIDVYVNGTRVHVSEKEFVLQNITENMKIEVKFTKKAFFETKQGILLIVLLCVLVILIAILIPVIAAIRRKRSYRIIQ